MPTRSQHAPVDVSVIMPFRDDEDVVGSACTRLATHLRGLGHSFELLAVEEDSGDNSHAVLGLMRASIPELEVLYARGSDRGYATAAEAARGRAVLLIDVGAAQKPLATIARSIRRVLDGEVDAVFAPGPLAVCHRTRTMAALVGVRGRRFGSLRRRIGRDRTLVLGGRRRQWLNSIEAAKRARSQGERPLRRLIGALTVSRS